MSDHYCCKNCTQRYDLCKCSVKNFPPKLPELVEEKVNHPSHYNQESIQIETIELIDLLTDRAAFDLGNAIKYICRAPYKEDAPLVEHLEKALWYVNDYISLHSYSEQQSFTKTENLLLNKIQQRMLSGTNSERICAKVLGEIHVAVNGKGAIRLHSTKDLLEKYIRELKEDVGEQHKRGEQ